MGTERPFVIVGSGLAGARTAESLRDEGFTGPVTLVGEENEIPYERPPLSKDYLMGKSARETTYVHEQRWYADHDIELRLSVPVTEVDPTGQGITLADGSSVRYSKLLMSTGSSPRRLPVPGAELGGVLPTQPRRQRSNQGNPAHGFPNRGYRRWLDRSGDRCGIGIVPNTRLGELAGVKVDNGIVVDAQLRTSDHDIFAAGDVANAFHPVLGKHIRVEHWANAQYQPQVVAKAMLGRDAKYDRMPYFFTDQYDLGMEYTGYVDPGGYDEVVIRGDVTASEFVAFWIDHGRVLAGMNVNVWDVTDPIESLIRNGAPIDTQKLADPLVPLESLVRSTARQRSDPGA